MIGPLCNSALAWPGIPHRIREVDNRFFFADAAEDLLEGTYGVYGMSCLFALHLQTKLPFSWCMKGV